MKFENFNFNQIMRSCVCTEQQSKGKVIKDKDKAPSLGCAASQCFAYSAKQKGREIKNSKNLDSELDP